MVVSVKMKISVQINWGAEELFSLQVALSVCLRCMIIKRVYFERTNVVKVGGEM